MSKSALECSALDFLSEGLYNNLLSHVQYPYLSRNHMVNVRAQRTYCSTKVDLEGTERGILHHLVRLANQIIPSQTGRACPIAGIPSLSAKTLDT